MIPTRRAERLFDEAKKNGQLNHVTGDGAPSIRMVTDAIHDAEADGYQAGSGDKHQSELAEIRRLRVALRDVADSTNPTMVFANAEADALRAIHRIATTALGSSNSD